SERFHRSCDSQGQPELCSQGWNQRFCLSRWTRNPALFELHVPAMLLVSCCSLPAGNAVNISGQHKQELTLDFCYKSLFFPPYVRFLDRAVVSEWPSPTKKPFRSNPDGGSVYVRLTFPKRYCSLALLAFLLILTPTISAQEASQSGTRYPQFVIFYSYHSSPENRPALRKYMETDGVAQFEKWKSDGVFKDYMILFSSYVHINSVPWDMLIRID